MAAQDGAPRWHISTRSASGNCVEVQAGPEVVLVRDSKNRDGAVLSFEPAAFNDFLESVKQGDFDRRG